MQAGELGIEGGGGGPIHSVQAQACCVDESCQLDDFVWGGPRPAAAAHAAHDALAAPPAPAAPHLGAVRHSLWPVEGCLLVAAIHQARRAAANVLQEAAGEVGDDDAVVGAVGDEEAAARQVTRHLACTAQHSKAKMRPQDAAQ